MSKKSMVLEYKTPLEFIATYAKKDLEPERLELEKLTGRTLLELIALVQEDDGFEWELQKKINNFALECNFDYCEGHEIYYEYDNCPFCSLGIRID